MMTNTGAAAFTAPEIQSGSSYKYVKLCKILTLIYSENIDVWGAGCVLYMLLFGVQPFAQKK